MRAELAANPVVALLSEADALGSLDVGLSVAKPSLRIPVEKVEQLRRLYATRSKKWAEEARRATP
jgi:hypothetical protein